MKASDIMTSPVIAVTPEASVHEIAALLLEHRISAVPVLSEGVLVGMVSEADLMHRHEIGTDRAGGQGSWWLRLFMTDTSVAEYIRSHAKRAEDIMSRDVVTVPHDAPVAKIAALLDKRGIKRVPVMRADRMIGIVSRANLVQALATKTRPAKSAPRRNDKAIRAALQAELARQPWWREDGASVVVTGGIVHYWGMVEHDEERAAARIAAENIDGVRGVEDHRFHVHITGMV